jgi:putative PIN family toxin of toxin-antitoxin system
LRVVIDTNVILSSILINPSTPQRAREHAENTGVVLYSDAQLKELKSVLSRQKFAKYLSTYTKDQIFERIQSVWQPVAILYNVQACSDPDDDKFLDIVVNGAATHLITGDRALLALNPFRNTKILTPSQFLTNSDV